MSGGRNYAFLLKQMKDRGSKAESEEPVVESLDSTVKAEIEGSEVARVASKIHSDCEACTNSAIDSLESRVENPDSSVNNYENRADGETSASGLVSGVETVDPRFQSLESSVKSPDPSLSTDQLDESRVKNLVSGIETRSDTLNLDALEEAIEEAKKKPKLGLYSPLAAAMLRYKAITTPRYSMGSEIKMVVEQALKDAYPELYQEIQKRMDL